MNIGRNMKIEKLFSVRDLNFEEMIYNKKNKNRSFIKMLWVKTIKLRIGCLFSSYRERIWICQHKI